MVPGRSLKQLKDRYGSADWALPILSQLAAALSAVHRAGVVHRDVKPANVIITVTDGGVPHATLVDFGASALGRVTAETTPAPRPGQERTSGRSETATESTRTLGAQTPVAFSSGEDGSLTQTGVVVGTPRSMAPELPSGSQEVGSAVDVFAFGILAYEILLGRGPFDDEPLALRLSGRPLPRPPELSLPGSQLQPHLAMLIERCVLEAPSQRPTAEELAAALGAETAVGR